MKIILIFNQCLSICGGNVQGNQTDKRNVSGMSALRGITDYRKEWDLRLSDEVPMDLSVDVGGGPANCNRPKFLYHRR